MTEFLVNARMLSYKNTDPVVTALPSNKFLIAWSRERVDTKGVDIYAQLFLASGQKLGDEFIVSPIHIGNDYYPDSASLSGGGFVISYMRYNNLEQCTIGKARIFGNDDTTITHSDVTLNSGGEDEIYNIRVSGLSHGGFIATWHGVRNSSNEHIPSYGVYGRIFQQDGTPTGEQFLVSQHDLQHDPDVVNLDDGRLIICWASSNFNEGRGIFAQIYDALGNKIKKDFMVNNNTDFSNDSPTVAALTTGGFVVVWDSAMRKIYAKAYATDGIEIGEATVHTRVSCCINSQSVTALPEGGFLVLWSESNINNRYDYDVFGQKFTADVTKSGQVFIVNSATDGIQMAQSSATLWNGNIVVTWMSQRQENCSADLFSECYADIFAQYYTQDLTPIEISD